LTDRGDSAVKEYCGDVASATLKYRRSVAGSFGIPLLVFGVVVVVAGLWPGSSFTPLGRTFAVVAGFVMSSISMWTWFRHWFVTVRMIDAGLVVTGKFGGEGDVIPWSDVRIRANRERSRLILTAEAPYHLDQPIWPQMWQGFDEALAWMQERPVVLDCWDDSAREAYRLSKRAERDWHGEP
jgi:hypothetical protein